MDDASRAKIPNMLTLSRVGLAAVFFAMLSLRSLVGNENATLVAAGNTGGPPASSGIDYWLLAAAALFILAAITDALDGHFARKWNVVSVFGRVMDSFADKVLVLGAFVYLAGPGFAAQVTEGVGTDHEITYLFRTSGVAVWMTVLIVARELLVTSIRGVYESQGIDFSAGWQGKWKMVLQCITIPLILLILAFNDPWPGDLLQWVINIAVWLTVIVTVWSGWPYITRAIQASKDLSAGGSTSSSESE